MRAVADISGVCRFCEKRQALIQSHIVSGFAVRDQKARGGTPHLISTSTGEPPRLVQDSPKFRLLCEVCDSIRLGKWEGEFSRRFFRVLGTEGADGLPYGPWLLKFCAVACWRLVAYFRESGGPPNFSIAQIALAERAQHAWKAVIVGTSASPEPFDFHILPLNRGPSQEDRLASTSTGMHAYTDRASGAALVIVKMQHVIVVGSIYDPDASLWASTRILWQGRFAEGSGTFPVPATLQEYLDDTLRKASAMTALPVEEVKTGSKPARRPVRRGPDYTIAMHYLGPAHSRIFAVEMRPIDERWPRFRVAFPSPSADHGAHLRFGPSKIGPWALPDEAATIHRDAGWNSLRTSMTVEDGMAAYLVAPRIPNLVLFGSEGGRQFNALLGPVAGIPPLPQGWVEPVEGATAAEDEAG